MPGSAAMTVNSIANPTSVARTQPSRYIVPRRSQPFQPRRTRVVPGPPVGGASCSMCGTSRVATNATGLGDITGPRESTRLPQSRSASDTCALQGAVNVNAYAGRLRVTQMMHVPILADAWAGDAFGKAAPQR